MAEKISLPYPELLPQWQTFLTHGLTITGQRPVEHRGLARSQANACLSRKFQPKSRPNRVILTRDIQFERSRQRCSAP